MDALEAALAEASPEIFNADQGAQFTATAFTSRFEQSGPAIAMDGRGRFYCRQRPAQPKRPAATSKPRPPASPPIPAKPERSAPVWRVASVHEGDLLRAIAQGKTERKVRLVGIDAPESGQAVATNSRDRLAAMTKGRPVEVHADSEDRFGRTLARQVVDGLDATMAMVAGGLAWQLTRYSDDERLAAAEHEARAAPRELWADVAPVAPSE